MSARAQPRPTEPPTEPRWASLAEAAVYSRVPAPTLRRWIAEGLLPAYRLGPRRMQIDLNDIDRMRRLIPAAAAALADGTA